MAVLFLIAVSLELGNPAEAPPATAILAVAYLFFAAAILLATWDSWWADARLAVLHALDIAMSTLMVLLTQGYTSPFFTFFMFLLLSAAIRWGWKATALTAVLVTLLYLIVGLIDVKATADFDLQRFLVRTGHLVILSLILIWFGINQWRSRFSLGERELLANPSLDHSPVEASLRAAVTAVRASRGAFAWWEQGSDTKTAATLREGELALVPLVQSPVAGAAVESSFLYDLARDRALRREPERGLRTFEADTAIDPGAAKALALTEGLAIPVRTETGAAPCSSKGSRPCRPTILTLPTRSRPTSPRTCSAMPWSARPRTAPRRGRGCRSPATSTTASCNSSPAPHSASRRCAARKDQGRTSGPRSTN